MINLKTETKAQKYLRLYRWLKMQGYSPKVARASARYQMGFMSNDPYWKRYWKYM